jgi:hypothetical protein
MLWALIGFVLLLIWIVTMVDIFRRADLTRGKKAAWALIVLLVPIIGVIAYFIVRPPDPVGSRFGEVSESTTTAEEQFRSRHPA